MKRTPGILVCSGAGACVTDVSVISRIDFAYAVSPIYVVDEPARIQAQVEEALRIAAGYVDYVRRLNNGPPR